MTILKILLATVAIGISTTLIGGLFIGWLFHPYQKTTPGAWRPETKASYGWSVANTFLFGLTFYVFYGFAGAYVPFQGLDNAILLGAICWSAFSLPTILGWAIFVNLDRRFVVGQCAAGFFEILAAAAIAWSIYNW